MNVVVTVGEELVEGEGWGGREGDSDISACLLTAVCNTQVLIKIALEGGSREGGREGQVISDTCRVHVGY